MVYLYAIKSSCQGEMLGKRSIKFITNLSNLILFRVSGDISCSNPFCKRKFQSQNKFTPSALKQHLENPGNWHEQEEMGSWHERKGNISNDKTFT